MLHEVIKQLFANIKIFVGEFTIPFLSYKKLIAKGSLNFFFANGSYKIIFSVNIGNNM